jgi:hypothetical protein
LFSSAIAQGLQVRTSNGLGALALVISAIGLEFLGIACDGLHEASAKSMSLALSTGIAILRSLVAVGRLFGERPGGSTVLTVLGLKVFSTNWVRA